MAFRINYLGALSLANSCDNLFIEEYQYPLRKPLAVPYWIPL